jgi:hypothetical protein
MAAQRRSSARPGAGRRGTPKDDLEALWGRNKAIRKKAMGKKLSREEFQSLPPPLQHQRPLSPQEYQSIPSQLRFPPKAYGFERSEGLRGPVLVQYLMLLEVTWRDKRFGDCINALLEHEIVNPGEVRTTIDPRTYEFTDRQGPEIDSSNEYMEAKCLEEVRARIERCGSERQASRQIAAEWGLPGNSLDAVAKGLRDKLRALKK